METLDLAPSTRAVSELVLALTDDELSAPTPCPAYTVADLVDHIGGLTIAFTAAARKQTPEHGNASGNGSRLEPGFRDRIAADLDVLAQAWTEAAAYDGMTQAGGVDLPGSVAAQVALNEVVVHGWDLAVATGRAYEPHPDAVETCAQFVASFEPPDEADGGPFGTPRPVADDASGLDRLVALAGRDPSWHA